MTEISEKQMEDFVNEKFNYILDENKNAIPATILEWGEFRRKKENKILKQEYVNGKFVSTVFVGVVQCADEDRLGIFETMVFDGKVSCHDIYCELYDTYKEAEEGHVRAIQWVKDGCKEDE